MDELKSLFHPWKFRNNIPTPWKILFGPWKFKKLCSTPWKITRIIIPLPGKKKCRWTMLGHLTPWKKNNFNKTPWKYPKNYLKAPGNLSQNTSWKSSSTPLYGYKMEQPISREAAWILWLPFLFFWKCEFLSLKNRLRLYLPGVICVLILVWIYSQARWKRGDFSLPTF